MRSTMRFCGAFEALEELPRAEDRTEPDGPPREGVRAPFLAVDDAHGGVHDEARGAQRVDGIEQRAARGDDVLDEAEALAVVVRSFDPVAGSVLLRLLADDDERQPRLERRGRRERDGAELGRGDPRRVRRVLRDLCGDALAQRAQDVWARLEAVLVEVVARPLAGAEDEVALQVRVLDERAAELSVVHVQRRARRVRWGAACRPRATRRRT